MFKINNRNTETCKWSRYGFFTDNIEHTSHFFWFLVLSTLSKMFSGLVQRYGWSRDQAIDWLKAFGFITCKSSCPELFYKNILLTLPVPCISESCIKIKINLKFHFDTSLWCLKKVLQGLHKTFWGTAKKCENENLIWFFLFVRDLDGNG